MTSIGEGDEDMHKAKFARFARKPVCFRRSRMVLGRNLAMLAVFEAMLWEPESLVLSPGHCMKPCAGCKSRLGAVTRAANMTTLRMFANESRDEW
jgi:hypothetical protein